MSRTRGFVGSAGRVVRGNADGGRVDGGSVDGSSAADGSVDGGGCTGGTTSEVAATADGACGGGAALTRREASDVPAGGVTGGTRGGTRGGGRLGTPYGGAALGTPCWVAAAFGGKKPAVGGTPGGVVLGGVVLGGAAAGPGGDLRSGHGQGLADQSMPCRGSPVGWRCRGALWRPKVGPRAGLADQHRVCTDA